MRHISLSCVQFKRIENQDDLLCNNTQKKEKVYQTFNHFIDMNIQKGSTNVKKAIPISKMRKFYKIKDIYKISLLYLEKI